MHVTEYCMQYRVKIVVISYRPGQPRCHDSRREEHSTSNTSQHLSPPHIDSPSPIKLKHRGVRSSESIFYLSTKGARSYADCFEHTVYDALIEAHIQTHASSFPGLLFTGEGENGMSRISIKISKRSGSCERSR